LRRKKKKSRNPNLYGLAERRRRQIIDYLKVHGFATAAELADTVKVSPATVRRDLAELKSQKLLRRVHGGAVLNSFMPDLEARKKKFIEEKKRIGERAAGFAEEGDTIFLDGGSTTEEMAKLLAGRNIKVITNGLNIANILSKAEGVEVIVTGGNVYSPGQIMLGPITEEAISHLKADKAFISVEGIDADCVSNSNNLVIGTERAMMERADRVFILADHSKFSKRALVRLAGLDEVDYVITDSKPGRNTPSFLRKKKVALIKAH